VTGSRKGFLWQQFHNTWRLWDRQEELWHWCNAATSNVCSLMWRTADRHECKCWV